MPEVSEEKSERRRMSNVVQLKQSGAFIRSEPGRVVLEIGDLEYYWTVRAARHVAAAIGRACSRAIQQEAQEKLSANVVNLPVAKKRRRK